MAATHTNTALREGLLARLDLGPDSTDEQILTALDERQAYLAIGDVEPVALEQRTIRHSLFTYDLPGGGQAVARRGETVDLLPHDVERGEKFDAFTARPGVLPDPPAASTLPVFPAEAGDVEQDSWVDSGSVQEIMDAVNADPAIAAAVMAAEQRRKAKARKSLLDALAKMQAVT